MSKCKKCRGLGTLFIPLVECWALKNGEFCEDHFQHFILGKRCWLCLGSKRMSVVEIWWGRLREMYGVRKGKKSAESGRNLPEQDSLQQESGE